MATFIGLLLAFALAFLSRVDGFWRMNCAVIQTGRIDPLVNPGAVAAHVHTIVGASNIGVNATYESLVNSECTSCEIQADKSAYWSPLLYYQYPNGSFIEVPHGGSVIYYLARGPNANATIPYPKGLKILTGDKGARSFDNVTYSYGNADYPGTPIANRISFACLPDGPPMASQPYMFNTTCGNGMRAQIAFQSCWNGVDLYKSDNSHVAYLSGIDNGICSPDYPFQLPTLFMEVNYAVSQVADQSDAGRFVFSQGDTTGYGFHADFQNGWEEDPLTKAVEICLVPDNFGQISDCPYLQASDTNGYPYNCPTQPSQIGEQVFGLMDQLPGCITITEGPEEAPAASMECAADIPRPSITATIDSIPRPTAYPTPGSYYGLPNYKYLGCYNDSAASIRTLNEASTSNYSVMTVEWCQNWCMQQGYRLSGVEYAQECHCDNEINPTSVNGSDQCTWNCGGTMTVGVGLQELCGGLAYINVYNNTNSSFHAFGSNLNTAGNAEPYTPPAGFGPNYLGCWADSVNGQRTLTGPNIAQGNMTIEICAAYCTQVPGYQYYGLEFATQCYCGNAIDGGGVLLTPTSNPTNETCQMRCEGSEPEVCGGPNALSLYNNTVYQAPQAVSPIGSYQAMGCLSDPALAGRGLQGPSTVNYTSMTDEICVNFCLGYTYAGIEYGGECYCGNEIVTASGAQQMNCSIPDEMTCGGNIFEYCGGRGFMNLWVNVS